MLRHVRARAKVRKRSPVFASVRRTAEPLAVVVLVRNAARPYSSRRVDDCFFLYLYRAPYEKIILNYPLLRNTQSSDFRADKTFYLKKKKKNGMG